MRIPGPAPLLLAALLLATTACSPDTPAPTPPTARQAEPAKQKAPAKPAKRAAPAPAQVSIGGEDAAETAQREIRRYAEAVERFLELHMPITYAAFVASGRVAP